MAEGIKTPPKFDGLNFPIWKVKMTIVKMIVFLQSLKRWVVNAVIKPFSLSDGDKDTWFKITTRNLMQMQKLAMHYFKP